MSIASQRCPESKSREWYAHPWDETLVETKSAASTPHCPDGLHHRLRPVRRHLGLEHLKRLAKRRNLTNVARYHPARFKWLLVCMYLPPVHDVSTARTRIIANERLTNYTIPRSAQYDSSTHARRTHNAGIVTMFMIPPTSHNRSAPLYERDTAGVGHVRRLTNRDVGPIHAFLAGDLFDSHCGCGCGCAEEAYGVKAHEDEPGEEGGRGERERGTGVDERVGGNKRSFGRGPRLRLCRYSARRQTNPRTGSDNTTRTGTHRHWQRLQITRIAS